MGYKVTIRRQLIHWLLLVLLAILVAGSATAGLAVPGPAPVAPEREGLPASELGLVDLQPVAYLPLVHEPIEPAPWINTANRSEVRAFYLTQYLASEGVDSGWTGNHASCYPGATSEAFRQAIVLRINFFRSMAGIPAIAGLDPVYSSKAQAAALMMSVNRALSHNPPSSWDCYSEAGREGAGSSDLYLGVYGPAAISGYIYDPGSGNIYVGHRRWILYPQTRFMGSGDIPPRDGYPPANALWVFDLDNIWGPRPETRDVFVAWPPPGYVPYQVVYPRWSFSYPGANFSNATVTMGQDGQPISLTILDTKNGYGENTVVWEPDQNLGAKPQSDTTYHVSIGNVSIPGFPQPIEYDVIVFDPAS
jgi:hypothetical protein